MEKLKKIGKTVYENKEFITVCLIAIGLYTIGYRRGFKVAMRRK